MDAALLGRGDDLVRKNAFYLHSVASWHVALQALPSRDPAPRCIADGDETLKDLARALRNHVLVTTELKERTVRAALAEKLLLGLDDGANHASAHVAELARGNEVVRARHFVGVFSLRGDRLRRWV